MTTHIIPNRQRSIIHQMTYGDFVNMLSRLPREAVLYGDTGGSSDYTVAYYPKLTLRPSFHHEWDVQFDLNVSQTPLTVGEFLDFLISQRDTPLPYNETYLITNESFIYVGEGSSNSGAINGIRMNADGSFTLSTEHPYA